MTTLYAYTTTETLIAVDHVSLTLGGKLILRDVCAKVDNIEREGLSQGQVVCFLGPSGVGKTRLSRIIAGLDQPTSGVVNLRTAATGVLGPVVRGQVGMVSQNYSLFEYLTVAGNLAVAAKQSPHPTVALGRLAPLCDELGLTAYLQHYPAQLSGGTRQRVAIVRQLLCSEHVLVMDEPFSGLDPIMKRKACELIQRVAAMDTLMTVIVVTHDVTEGMSVADQVWLMGLEDEVDRDHHNEEGDIRSKRPGAKIVEYLDLAAENLAWHPDILQDPRFLQRVAYVKARFGTLL